MRKRPSILVTNDDGIHAPGIYALWEAMQEMGDVTVMAPNTEKSAVGHAVTISDPIRIEPITRHGGFEGYAVNGTPADCIKIAVGSFLEVKPDIVLSGINAGSNVGSNILYSGTVSAAAEGIMLGIPSIALSINTFKSDYYDLAKSVSQTMMKKVLHNGLPKGTLLNVNVPKCSASKCSGYKITRQGGEYFLDKLEKREDPRGRQYFWMGGKIINNDKSDDQDGNALANNWISITPIQYKLTDNSFLDTLSNWDFE